MKSETVKIDSSGKGVDRALKVTEETVAPYVKDEKLAHRIRLLSEESLEVIRNLAEDHSADFHININDTLCEIRVRVRTKIDQEKRSRIQDAMERYRRRGTISDRIGLILESDFEGIKGDKAAMEAAGLYKADAAEMTEDDNEAVRSGGSGVKDMRDEVKTGGEKAGDSKEMLVWSMQSYSMSGLMSEDSTVSNKTLVQISSSILANLSDDIKVYIFRDSAQLIVQKYLTDEGSVSGKEYAISPEFERLKKIPVATTLFQVKMVQLMYRRLMKKQTDTPTLSCKMIKLPVPMASGQAMDCLIYSPKDLKDGETAPCVLLLHGGAFVFPALPYHYNIAREAAEALHCRVFVPGYDLAPGKVPPTQQEQCFSVYSYLLEHASEFGIDRDRLAIMGDSAGGTLCAALTLMLRQRELPQPRAQLLFYPSLDARLESRSMKKYTDVPIVNSVAVEAYYKICDFEHFKGDRALASPVEAGSFEGIPDTYVETAEFDCLHDDGVLYADLLQRAGCNVILNETRGTVHAFDMAADSSIRKEVMAQRLAFLKEVFSLK